MQGFDQYSFGEIMQIETLSEARDQEKIKKALLITTKSAGVYFTKEISINMKEESSETKETLFGRSDNLIDQDRHSLQKKFAEAQKI